MPKPSKPNPFRGWAVFNGSGELLWDSLHEDPEEAFRLAADSRGLTVEEIKRECTACRVTVMPGGGDPC